MHITRLNIERVRNLQTVALQGLQPFNVFYGSNGSGKTSLLEAIHLLATGRSFRTHIPKHYIQYQASDAIVFAQSASERIGMQKLLSGEQIIKVNGDSIATQGQLAKLLPLQHIDPQSTDILDHGAKPRRQLLDWLMFHVEHDFYPIWQNYSRALKQRNALLKIYPAPEKQRFENLKIWNQVLAQEGERIHLLRESIVERWQDDVKLELQYLLPDLKIELEYYAGFSTELGLAAQLEQDLSKDLERRTTQHGVHRADLRLKTGGDALRSDTTHVLSRGQKKLLIIALKLAQIAMLNRSNKETVVLLDDLTAELDQAAQQRLLERLSQLGSQVFLTTLDHTSVLKHLHELSISFQLFHVVDGQVSLVAP